MDRTATLPSKPIVRVAGLLYLLILFGAIFAEYYVRNSLIMSGDATATLQNIAGNHQRFRLGMAAELLTFVGIIALAWSFYLVLRSVNRNLALLGMLFWVAEGILLGTALVFHFGVLYFVRDPAFLQDLDSQQQDALSYLFLLLFYKQYEIGLLFFSVGSFLFSLLFFKSRYIPRLLAVLGMIGAALMFVRVPAVTLVPTTSVFFMGVTGTLPIALYELLTGLWLIIRGVKISDHA